MWCFECWEWTQYYLFVFLIITHCTRESPFTFPWFGFSPSWNYGSDYNFIFLWGKNMITNCWQCCRGAWAKSCGSYFLKNASVLTEVITTATLPSFLSYSPKSPYFPLSCPTCVTWAVTPLPKVLNQSSLEMPTVINQCYCQCWARTFNTDAAGETPMKINYYLLDF